MINLIGKKIGVWGLGIVGKSIINFLSSKKISLNVLENRNLNDSEKNYLKEKNASFFNQEKELKEFLNKSDYVISSPGIDISSYKNYENKWLTELDIFFSNFNKPIIAITGTVGKTTITQFLYEILKSKKIKTVAAGNIGLGMCDLISMQSEIDLVVLEVSSFQLEHCKYFAPDLAIWTNFYPNHLDRHGDLKSYFDAKSKIYFNQNKNQKRLLPFKFLKENYNLPEKTNFFSLYEPSKNELELLRNDNVLFFCKNKNVYKLENSKIEYLFDISDLSDITYLENWLIICITLYLQKIDISGIDKLNLYLPAHRFEKFVSFNNIDFYNDSKSTIPDATIAAVNKLSGRPIILFLGGLSKGVDRSLLIDYLKDKVKYIICFGVEAIQLKHHCDQKNVAAQCYENLDSAVNFCFSILKENDQVLFSPSGSSFDLFKDYQDRGNQFKQLILEKIKKFDK